MKNSKIATFDSLRYLVDLDETDHDMKEMANLFIAALRDWGNCQNIVKCVEDFKAYFGNPLTVENTAHYTGRSHEDWAWRGEAGMSLSELIAMSTKAYNIADFDTIVDNFLGHYERKYLLTTKGKPLSNTGFAGFSISADNLTAADCVQWLGMGPDDSDSSDDKNWTITTPLTVNMDQSTMIRQIVKRLLPIKDRLIALKQAYPNVHYQVYVVIWSSTLNISLGNDTLQFLGEIGAGLSNEMFGLT